jgi:hypothetical protein
MRATPIGWSLDRLGLTVVPVGVDIADLRAVQRLLDAADAPLAEAAPTAVEPLAVQSTASPLGPIGEPVVQPFAQPFAQPCVEPFVEVPWTILVRVLGGVDVVSRDDGPIGFERGKSLELTAWLATHRNQATRTAARTALWDLDVRDATFANVVSDARRSLARAVVSAEGEEWIGRTLTEQLPLHPHVVTDAELLRRRLDHSRGLGPSEAIEVLRPGVALVRDLPFAGTDFLWPHAEGITSSLAVLAVSAAVELARHHLALGDLDGVFWATGQGLLALPGHEELIGLRMRAHAQLGDLAGVRQEWEAYERAVTSGSWCDGEASPKLLALRRELLQR